MNLKSKILIICGPTATGKTNLALNLAKEFDGELISADSRQVYTGLDLITGKDIPENFYPVTPTSHAGLDPAPVFYTDGITRIYGYDLVKPEQDWSVSHFTKIAHPIISDIHSRGKLPIIVGGTGLYLKELICSSPSIQIPPDPILRAELEALSVDELQRKLELLNPQRLTLMNHSDLFNPRRLIRAIELQLTDSTTHLINPPLYDPLFIGITASLDQIKQKITARVEKRLRSDLTQEVSLLEKISPNLPAASTLGYRQYSLYQQGQLSFEKAVELWSLKEFQYAKRQIVWFKKQPNINWFSTPINEALVVARVRLW